MGGVELWEVEAIARDLGRRGGHMDPQVTMTARDVLRRSGRLSARDLAELDTWDEQKIQARLFTLKMELR